MPYSKQWGGPHPGCIIFLLDQSGSMESKFGAGLPNSGQKKSDMVAVVLNGFLQELITTNTLVRQDATIDVRPRADIAVIGYEGEHVKSALEGEVGFQPFVSLPELQANPARTERYELKEIDPRTGGEMQRTIEAPIWVESKAGGGTPMCAAIRRARELASQWVMSHPDNYPPVVINVTDGQSTDGDPTQDAKALRQVSTSDGETLLFNVHITETRSMPVYYPASESEVMGDKFARLLFSISSEIPESSRHSLAAQGTVLQPGARGMIFNGDALSVRQMFQFGTLAATVPLNPNM